MMIRSVLRWKGKVSSVLFQGGLNPVFCFVGKVHMGFDVARIFMFEILVHPFLHIHDLLMVFTTRALLLQSLFRCLEKVLAYSGYIQQ